MPNLIFTGALRVSDQLSLPVEDVKVILGNIIGDKVIPAATKTTDHQGMVSFIESSILSNDNLVYSVNGKTIPAKSEQTLQITIETDLPFFFLLFILGCLAILNGIGYIISSK